MNFKAFNDYIDELINHEIPPALLEHLNGGIKAREILQEDDDETDYIILGEYIEDNLGSHINLYYGSFMHFYAHKSDDKFKKKILTTIKHELTHHMESLTGHEYLAYEEDLEVAARKKKKIIRE